MNGPKEKQSSEERDKSLDDERASYYYDDAHGYQEYDPEKDAEDDEEDDEIDDQASVRSMSTLMCRHLP